MPLESFNDFAFGLRAMSKSLRYTILRGGPLTFDEETLLIILIARGMKHIFNYEGAFLLSGIVIQDNAMEFN